MCRGPSLGVLLDPDPAPIEKISPGGPSPLLCQRDSLASLGALCIAFCLNYTSLLFYLRLGLRARHLFSECFSDVLISVFSLTGSSLRAELCVHVPFLPNGVLSGSWAWVSNRLIGPWYNLELRKSWLSWDPAALCRYFGQGTLSGNLAP